MIVSPKTAAIAAPPSAGHAETQHGSRQPTRVEAAAALLLIRKAILNDPSIARKLDLAA